MQDSALMVVDLRSVAWLLLLAALLIFIALGRRYRAARPLALGVMGASAFLYVIGVATQ